jgi:threonine aldolase
MKKAFASDNYAGVLPEILEAISYANQAHAPSYGNDAYTANAKTIFAKYFGCEDVAFVFNGTGANVLGISCVTQSFHAVLCADIAHLYVDETTAPQTFTQCKLVPLPTNKAGKLELETIENAIIRKGDPHFAQIKVLSISQPTEYGTVYSLEELKAIGALLHKYDIIFHIDGARIFNAAASLGCSLQAITKDVGADIVSVGGTKVGLLFGEAVIFFQSEHAQYLRYKHKQSMQLASKTRFIATQFEALLEQKLWIRSATHANAMAQMLANGLEACPIVQITKPVQANAVFAILPTEWQETLQTILPFYVWNEKTQEVRLMCSFDTTTEEIEKFIEAVEKLSVGNI